MAPKIALADVTKTYQVRGRPVTALRGVSLDVADSEFLCVVGPSGCGRLLENFAPGTATTVFAYSGGFMKNRPEVATRFLAALIQAARAMQGQKYLEADNVAACKKYTGVRHEILQGEPPLI